MVRATRRRTTIEVDMAALRRQFRRTRVARGLSQARAAELLGVSQATVSSFESGKYAAVRDETVRAVRTFVETWRDPGTHARKTELPRVVLMASGDDVPGGCVWCDSPLPNMDRPAKFCPRCGGRQWQPHMATIGSDMQTRCCPHCGRPFDRRDEGVGD